MAQVELQLSILDLSHELIDTILEFAANDMGPCPDEDLLQRMHLRDPAKDRIPPTKNNERLKTCSALSKTCRLLHTLMLPHLHAKLSFSSTGEVAKYSALSRQRSAVKPAPGYEHILFGLMVREIDFSFFAGGRSDRLVMLMETLAQDSPNVTSLRLSFQVVYILHGLSYSPTGDIMEEYPMPQVFSRWLQLRCLEGFDFASSIPQRLRAKVLNYSTQLNTYETLYLPMADISSTFDLLAQRNRIARIRAMDFALIRKVMLHATYSTILPGIAEGIKLMVDLTEFSLTQNSKLGKTGYASHVTGLRAILDSLPRALRVLRILFGSTSQSGTFRDVTQQFPDIERLDLMVNHLDQSFAADVVAKAKSNTLKLHHLTLRSFNDLKPADCQYLPAPCFTARSIPEVAYAAEVIASLVPTVEFEVA